MKTIRLLVVSTRKAPMNMATMKTCYQSCCGDYDGGGGGGGGGGENADDTFDIMIYMISDSSPCQCLPKARGASASRSWLS